MLARVSRSFTCFVCPFTVKISRLRGQLFSQEISKTLKRCFSVNKNRSFRLF